MYGSECKKHICCSKNVHERNVCMLISHYDSCLFECRLEWRDSHVGDHILKNTITA